MGGLLDGEERKVNDMYHSVEFDTMMVGAFRFGALVYIRDCTDDTVFLFSHHRELKSRA
jgi:hypothetical protein